MKVLVVTENGKEIFRSTPEQCAEIMGRYGTVAKQKAIIAELLPADRWAKVTGKNAQDRRYNAIGVLSEKYGHLMDDELAPLVDEIVLAIKSLVVLGRTDRWARGAKNWAKMIEEDRKRPRWALLQGMIQQGWAA